MAVPGLEIRNTDFTEPQVRGLVEFHLSKMYETSPAESVFALGVEALQSPLITGFAAWNGSSLSGIGALKHCDGYGEIKSMRTAPDAAGTGVGSAILERIEQYAASLDLECLKLETGPPPHFAAANKFYEKHGFRRCGLFGEYIENRHSVFYEKAL